MSLALSIVDRRIRAFQIMVKNRNVWRRLFLSGVLAFLAACSTVIYRLSEDATEPFLDTHRYYEWQYSVSEYPEELVPSVYRLARLRNQPIDAIIRTQHGFHSYAYSVFSDSQVVITSISFRVLMAKGHAPYSDPRPWDLIEILETEGKCSEWLPTDVEFVHGDFLIYGEIDDRRICGEPDAFWGGPNRIRVYLWSNYEDENSTWTYRRNAEG